MKERERESGRERQDGLSVRPSFGMQIRTLYPNLLGTKNYVAGMTGKHHATHKVGVEGYQVEPFFHPSPRTVFTIFRSIDAPSVYFRLSYSAKILNPIQV